MVRVDLRLVLFLFGLGGGASLVNRLLLFVLARDFLFFFLAVFHSNAQFASVRGHLQVAGATAFAFVVIVVFDADLVARTL